MSDRNMSDHDVENIGRHCQLEYCGQLDFLPFPCASCKKYYCLDHRSETAHACTDARNRQKSDTKEEKENTTTEPPKSISSTWRPEGPCARPSCKTRIDGHTHNGGVECPRCNRRYCMTDRHEEKHDCKTLEPIGARPNTVQQHTQSALAKLKLWAEKKRAEDEKRRIASKKTGFFGLGKSSTSAASSAQAELNALKRVAKGDAKVPPEKRIYLTVEASADTTKAKYPTGKFFYNKDASVGRVLDMAAKALMVENVNNRSELEEDKLRVFHVQGGRLLKFSEKIGDVTLSGNMIILLRGVGSGEPDLIDLSEG
ncbi:hypothetical protein C7974DRAFT_406448 [Boeremia exigua]|uniref:uncharacterized protein n=1 Tax=Boeremia exigua TaxID=749465 RepID=UPI001E8DCD9D|nr:uncharacterized protein C7974DRAFT_406448 [Boeremia exigua]KAH6611868.1 hypothetical protein C7974DRAFT_406448 [Boeremia exigua]